MLRSREGDVEHGITINPKMDRITFEDAAADIENDYVANKRKSIDGLKRRIAKHLTPYFGGRRLASITTAEVRAYIAHRLTEGTVAHNGKRKGERVADVGNAQINHELKALKRMSLAIEAGKLGRAPRIPLLKENNVRIGFFEAEQFEAVRKHLPPALRPLVTFMYLTGWRRGEASSLEWRQVDFGAGEVRLDPGTTKNDDGRVFPFTRELRELLEEQDRGRKQLQQAAPSCCGCLGRCEGSGAPERPAGRAKGRDVSAHFGKRWKAAYVAAGCPGRIPHDFRRTAVRNLVRMGIPERVAMMLTGHKTRSVFERYNDRLRWRSPGRRETHRRSSRAHFGANQRQKRLWWFARRSEFIRKFWSGRRGSNPRHRAWEARVLPLNYSRTVGCCVTWVAESPGLPASQRGDLRVPRRRISVTATQTNSGYPGYPGNSGDPAYPRISCNTSSRRFSMSSGVAASRLRRSSGSVFEGRTLKCQSG